MSRPPPPAWLPATLPDALAFYRDALSADHKPDVIREARRLLARNDLYYLLTVVLGRVDMAHPWVFERCREVQFSPDRHLDLWAREHYKSPIITFGLSIQDILASHGEDADQRYGGEVTIGIFSVAKDLAVKFLRQIKQEFEANKQLKGLFPDILWSNPKTQAPKWSEQDGITVKRDSNPREATVEAHGLVDAQPIGAHFKIRTYDDVVTPKSVTNPEMIIKTTEMAELSDNLGTKDGTERWVGTRYHFGDTYGIQIDRGALRPRLYPATHNGRLDGKPVFLSPEVWEQKKISQPTTISAQMLQNPAAGQDATFQVSWLRFYETRPATLRIYILVDPSKGRHKRSDRTAMAVIGVDVAQNRYLLDGVRHRMDLDERWFWLKRLHRKWSNEPGVSSVEIGYEQYGLVTDIEHFNIMMPLEKVWFGITELNWPHEGSNAKVDRVERLVPDFKGGRFHLPARVLHDNKICRPSIETDEFSNIDVKYRPLKPNEEFSADMRRLIHAGQDHRIARPIKRIDRDKKPYDVTVALISEYKFFPFGSHDDLIDSCSRVYDMQPISATPKPKQADLEPEAHQDGV